MKFLLQKIKRYGSSASLCFLLVGVGYVGIPLLQEKYSQHVGVERNIQYLSTHPSISPARTPVVTRPSIGLPVTVLLPRLNIDLNVVVGAYNTTSQQWKLDRQHLFFVASGSTPLSSSAPPLLYGHKIPGVLENIGGIAANEPLIIINDTGHTLLFKYVGKVIVDPNDGAQLNNLGVHADLMLLTCSGINFDTRQINYFQYVGEERTTILPGRLT